MAGELWRERWAAGVESAYGSDVAATRVLYFRPDSVLTRERDARPKAFGTGTRDNVRAFTLGPEMASGRVSQDVSPSENIELFLCGIKGGVTPTTPGGATLARLWTFVPGSSALDSMTLENHDGAVARQMTGTVVDRLTIAGSANGENLVTTDLIGKSITAAALTGSLADRVPDFLEGHQAQLFVDAFGATPGTTELAATLVNWNVVIGNGLERLYRASNANTVSRLSTGAISVEATLTVDATVSAIGTTAFSDWDAATKKLVRLKFTGATAIESTTYPYVAIDIPGAWSAYNLGGTDGNSRVYELRLSYVYDPTNAFGLQVTAMNARTAAWA
jgi:hypothetical protein